MQNIGKLVFVRHGESEWNKLGIWTGITNVHLSEHGRWESKKIGELLKDIIFDKVFISALIRTQETYEAMTENNSNIGSISVFETKELNERDYGDYTGKNKWEMEKSLGEETFQKIRRSWDWPIPNGESLKMVYERTVPFFIERILPELKEGKNIIVIAHGNSIRSIVKYIESIPDEKIAELEIPFEEVRIYDVDNDGKMIKKETRSIDSHPEKNSKYNSRI